MKIAHPVEIFSSMDKTRKTMHLQLILQMFLKKNVHNSENLFRQGIENIFSNNLGTLISIIPKTCHLVWRKLSEDPKKLSAALQEICQIVEDKNWEVSNTHRGILT